MVAELGIGFVPYSPLVRGFLTGRIRSPEDVAADDFRRASRRFQGKNLTRALDLEVTAAELARLDEPAPASVAVGDRYDDMGAIDA